MQLALLSFAHEPPHDPLGDVVQRRLEDAALPDLRLVRETLRPDLGRLKGLLLAALTDPRFDGIVVLADLPGTANDALVGAVASSMQAFLPAWPLLNAQLLWPHLKSDLLWAQSVVGRSQGRLLAALTGHGDVVSLQLEQLLIPQLPRLVEWSKS